MVAKEFCISSPRDVLWFDNHYLLNRDTFQSIWKQYGKIMTELLLLRDVYDDETLYLRLSESGELNVVLKSVQLREDEVMITLLSALLALHCLATFSLKIDYSKHCKITYLSNLESCSAGVVRLDRPVFDEEEYLTIRSNTMRSFPDDVLRDAVLPTSKFVTSRHALLK